MKKFFALILIVSAATLALGRQAQTDDWVKFTSPEGRFSVLMPVQPQKDSKTATDRAQAPTRRTSSWQGAGTRFT